MSDTADSTPQKRLDLAARVAWSYYVKGRTQDEIARTLALSRQVVQRLLLLASTESLIKFRLDHPLRACIEVGEHLTERLGLRLATVAPGMSDEDNRDTVAIAAATHVENLLSRKAPAVICLGIGRTLRDAVRQVPSLSCPQHKLVSLVGNVTRDGRSSRFDVVNLLADRTGAEAYTLPMPIITATPQEREMYQALAGYRSVKALAAAADTIFVGVGAIAWDCPIHTDGFIDDRELGELLDAGAIGEVAGWSFDAAGAWVRTGLHDRLTAIPLDVPAQRTTILVACGVDKVGPIAAVLKAGIANGLITDELTAKAILDLT